MKSERIFAIVCVLIAVTLIVLAFLSLKYIGRDGAKLLALLAVFFGLWARNCWHDGIDGQDR
jgi:hypothetical protein